MRFFHGKLLGQKDTPASGRAEGLLSGEIQLIVCVKSNWGGVIYCPWAKGVWQHATPLFQKSDRRR